MSYRRAWKGDEWQAFALQLVQLRHGAENVQVVPDAVRGDAGLEFFTTSGCLYQCYAPQEASDVAKAASAMKAKAGTDLPKLAKYKDKIEPILSGIVASRWILLCPFLDNKEVVADVRKRGLAIKSLGLSFLDPGFEALCQCQENFAGEIEQLKVLSLGPPLKIDMLCRRRNNRERNIYRYEDRREACAGLWVLRHRCANFVAARCICEGSSLSRKRARSAPSKPFNTLGASLPVFRGGRDSVDRGWRRFGYAARRTASSKHDED